MRPAGWGTSHVGRGRCKLHGGALKGAEEGNQTRTIHSANMIAPLTASEKRPSWIRPEDEQFWDELSTDDYIVLCNQIKTAQFRIKLMLDYIDKYRDQLLSSPDGMGLASVDIETGSNDKGAFDRRIERKAPLAQTIHTMQEQLAKAESSLARLIDVKRQIEEKRNGTDINKIAMLGKLIVTIEGAAKQEEEEE